MMYDRRMRWSGMVLCMLPAVGLCAGDDREQFLSMAFAKCSGAEEAGRELSRGRLALGPRRSVGFGDYLQANGDMLRIYEQDPRSGARLYEFYRRTGKGLRAVVSARFDATCRPVEGREIVYDAAGRAEGIHWLGQALERAGRYEGLNPPVPVAAGHAGVRVGLIDSGVNYLVPEIALALARDAQGHILGYDFREMDDRPFDVDPLKRGPFSPVRHGTSVASVLLSHGDGQISLVPYSFPGADPKRFKLLVGDLRRNQVRVVNMSMGSTDPRAERSWREIAKAVESVPEILFVVAAGNEGKDLGRIPHYPASFRLANVLVVGAVDQSGKVSAQSNYGAGVDVAAVADPVAGRDFAWKAKDLYGTSFAAPKIAALAAKVLADEPGLNAVDLKNRICSMASPVRGKRKIACGYY